MSDRVIGLVELRTAQGLTKQSSCRIPQALGKYRQGMETSLRIAATDANNPEAELNDAMATSNRIQSDRLSCLDQRKIAVLNLGRVAERKGEVAGGMERRRGEAGEDGGGAARAVGVRGEAV